PYACDPDRDNDGIPNEVDVCELVFDPYQGDLDGDGVGDACDNCIYTANPGQEDRGHVWPNSQLPLPPNPIDLPDGIGDACQCGDVNDDGWVSQADLDILSGCLSGSGAPACGWAVADTDGVPGLSQADLDVLEDALEEGIGLGSLLCAARP